MPVTTAGNDLLFDIEDAAGWHGEMHAAGMIPYWVISDMQVAYPGMLIARAWTAVAIGNGVELTPTPYNAVVVAPDLLTLRGLLPGGLLLVDRSDDDPLDVVERWMS